MSLVSRWGVVLVTAAVLAAPFAAGAEPGPDFAVKLDAGPPPDVTVVEGGAADLPVTPDKGPTVDGPVVIDGGTPATCAQAIGKACTSAGSQCGAMATCLLSTTTTGVCTCGCVPDDASTPLVNEDTCPDLSKNVCGRLQLSDGTIQNTCFRKCQPKLGSNACSAPLACSPRAGAAIGSYDTTVCLFDGCAANSDCPVTTGVSCTVGSTGSCGAGETCVALATGSTKGLCTKNGLCDLKSGLCGKHSTTKPGAKVGDPCKGDTDCGEYMGCEIETDLKALGGKEHGVTCTDDNDCCSRNCESKLCVGACAVHARNGYCMVRGCGFATALAFSEFACPTGSDCNIVYSGGLCQKSCTLATASDCRGNSGDKLGDYECRAWNNLAIGGAAISKGPVCDFGDSIRCTIFGTSTLDCSYLGTQPSNGTNMSCRKMDNTKLTNPKDPQGWCLDDTASGPGGTTPADAGVQTDTTPADATVAYDWVPWPADTGSAAADGTPVTPPDEEDGGCSCSTSGGAGGGWVVLLALGLLALVRRRRAK
jgi:MYXO-CTERM domain-containing protein